MKTRNKFLILLVTIVMAFTAISCQKVIDGNKITDAVMTVDFYGASGEVVSTYKLKVEIFNNNAPKTAKHVKSLIKSKYFDGVCFNNVSNYFITFGAYTYGEGNTLVKKAYDGKAIEGEFERNGLMGQKLSASASYLVMKHDYTGAERYDTATNEIMIMLGSCVDITAEDYAVFGRIVMTDGADIVTSTSTSDIDQANRTGLSSFKIISTLTDLRAEIDSQNQITKTMYYHEPSGKYYLKVEDQNADTLITYYEGLEIDPAKVVDEAKTEELNNSFLMKKDQAGSYVNEFYDFDVLPYRHVVIRSFRLK